MFDTTLTAPTRQEIHAAEDLVAPYIIRTPLLRLNLHDRADEIYLELENLQPIGVFKVSCMGNEEGRQDHAKKIFRTHRSRHP
jgi:threonine dehydratase